MIELTMMISIIGILAAILLPSLARSREAGRRVSCSLNLAQLGMAMRIYADESNGELPWSGGGDNADCLLLLYRDANLDFGNFVCPSDSSHTVDDFQDFFFEKGFDGLALDHAVESIGFRCSYNYLGAYTDEPIRLPKPTRQPRKIAIMWDHASRAMASFNHVPGGTNVLWLDGSVTFVPMEGYDGVRPPFAPEDVAFPQSAPRMRRVEDFMR